MGPITGSLWDPKRGPEFGISTKDNSGTSGPTRSPYRILGVPFCKGGDPFILNPSSIILRLYFLSSTD